MIEDSSSLTAIYKAYLEETDYKLACVASLSAAYPALSAFQPDIVLLDIELPDGNGMEFMAEINAMEVKPKVIVMTAYGTSDMAVQAIQKGAFDFLTKPFDAARLRVTLDNAAAQRQLDKRIDKLSRDHYCDFIGKSPAMQSVYQTIDSLAHSDATAFIVGESGTGKELAAEAIHQQGSRSDNAFIAINCGAIPGELIESEIFGHVKGAFTGASTNRDGAASVANGGTLFLDEICEMDLVLQKKLLRFIQTGTFCKVGSNTLEKVDVRFVCATNRDPMVEVQEGRFREDLYYRLHVVPLRMPPVREREKDILMLAEHFLASFAEQEAKNFQGFSSEAEEIIRRYPWPGNVRQLQNAVQQIVVLYDGEIVEPAMLPESVNSGAIEIQRSDRSQDLGRPAAVQQDIPREAAHVMRRQQIEPLWLTEKNAIESAIEACGNNVNRAAGLLEVAPSTLYRKLQSWKPQSA
jgi:DNA-binding NtrC family response regulator